ncbi:Glu/Leu/Phe/Val family dehydrogenase [Calorimonas adulescens]|uniref:Glu/Leu/Phe/Val dehydrogenase n=1 Tax=Calorimonas adulescens TaxID=2606906 RepID=A0A5D8QAZ8_9THEO|nr:Glu/Leu/Phe/Val dehydrogenase [Calorimonas adulescens]TZE81319.1 Glu/Leu/Phe/Val dehydrogenase [Calorimonas adulescens]
MELFSYMQKYDYEQVVFCHDKASGLKAIIAIHDTTLGPALGGCRMWTYSCEDDAIMDALRLAKGMTYKNAAAGLNLGGAKTVVIGDPKKDKSEALFRALGRFIQTLNGRYITAEDVGTNVRDMEYIRMETKYVAGLGEGSGDPSPFTALGVFQGIKAACKEVYGSDDLTGRKVAIQGIGNVGYNLAKLLKEAGAELIVTDIFEDNVRRAVEELGAKAVKADKIFEVECDIFAPCALGAVINDDTIDRLKCKIVGGSANNQLKEDKHGDMLQQRGILYVPDYIINAGGVINVAAEFEPGGYRKDKATRKVEALYDAVVDVIEISKRENIPTYKAADRLVENRINVIANVRNNYIR